MQTVPDFYARLSPLSRDSSRTAGVEKYRVQVESPCDFTSNEFVRVKDFNESVNTKAAMIARLLDRKNLK